MMREIVPQWQHCAHNPRWQHHFTVPITILDGSTLARGADGVYFQYGNALSTVSFQCVMSLFEVMLTRNYKAKTYSI